jgi:hypothetical protein
VLLEEVRPRETHGHRKNKGKCAVSTDSRRLVWEQVVWPLVLDLKRPYFTLEEYHSKRNQICELYGIPHSRLSGGFTSLVTRGLLTREKRCYSLQYRLIPFMRKRNALDYGAATKEGYFKS